MNIYNLSILRLALLWLIIGAVVGAALYFIFDEVLAWTLMFGSFCGILAIYHAGAIYVTDSAIFQRKYDGGFLLSFKMLKINKDSIFKRREDWRCIYLSESGSDVEIGIPKLWFSKQEQSSLLKALNLSA